MRPSSSTSLQPARWRTRSRKSLDAEARRWSSARMVFYVNRDAIAVPLCVTRYRRCRRQTLPEAAGCCPIRSTRRSRIAVLAFKVLRGAKGRSSGRNQQVPADQFKTAGARDHDSAIAAYARCGDSVKSSSAVPGLSFECHIPTSRTSYNNARGRGGDMFEGSSGPGYQHSTRRRDIGSVCPATIADRRSAADDRPRRAVWR